MGLTVHFEVLNQLGTPLMYSATLANRPVAGIAGRIFFRTDSPFGIYRDTGSAWDLIADGGGISTNIYNSDGTLTGNRDVSSGGFTLLFRPQTTFLSALIPTISGSSYSVLGQNQLTYAAGFSSNNIGNVYSANGAINLQTFSGSATFAQANLASAMVSVNSIDFSSAGSTITMTQSSGIRAMTGSQSQIQYQGTNSGTITHAAVHQNLGFYRPLGATGTLTITNAYSHLINALDDYGSGFTFTNRWGIYQAGVNDNNYFAGNVGIATITPSYKLDVNGTARVSGNFTGNANVRATGANDGSATGASTHIDFITALNYGRVQVYNYTTPALLALQLSASEVSIGGSPAGSTYQLNVQGSDNTLFSHTSDVSVVLRSGSSTSSQIFFQQSTTNKFSIGYVNATGGIRIYNWGIGAAAGVIFASTNNWSIGSTIDSGNKLRLNGSLRIDGQRSATSSGVSGQHLIIDCDGITYKIQLLNP